MKYKSILFSVVSCLVSSFSVHAIELSSAVKVSTVLKTDKSWDGQPIVYPEGKPEITGVVVEIAPGGETGWHSHPVPSFGMVLEGELEVQLKTGQAKRFTAGEALAEVTNALHNGRNVGQSPLKIIVFYGGVVGQKLSVKEGEEPLNNSGIPRPTDVPALFNHGK
ncbi:MAG: cupin domain-containing protein [Gammaproteobacteria bacterium]|nr:cupin domain-containing protein [Gammaproteobacteria bacterium]